MVTRVRRHTTGTGGKPDGPIEAREVTGMAKSLIGTYADPRTFALLEEVRVLRARVDRKSVV